MWIFDQDADGYHRGRPGYPEALYDVLETRCGLRPGSRVLEIGAGTGQATRSLLARGAHVTAVEPGPRLAARLSDELAGPRLTVVNGELDAVREQAGAFDLVTCATAFHWLDADASLTRLARLVRPGGWLAVWWTVFGDPEFQAPWREELDALIRADAPEIWQDPTELPMFMWYDERAAELAAHDVFGPVGVDVLRWQHRMDADRARDLFATFSPWRRLPAAQGAALLDGVAAIVHRHGGAVDDNYLTVLYTAPLR
jgi:SAM-dependent methyltransferase